MALSPNDRQLLLDAVRPPVGMRLDAAVGTTFTLDLTALLTVPLAAASQAMRDQDSDDIAFIEAVRRQSDRIAIFCQAGMIAVPQRYRTALVWAEGMIHEVRRPRPGHIFHPKVWALRFVDADGAAHHRIVVLSRNLTFDRCWDTVVRLDEDKSATSAVDSVPVAEFLQALTTRVARPMPRSRRELVEGLAASVARVHWQLPDGVDALTFLPLGLDAGSSWPFDPTAQRTLAISPFIATATVQRLASSSDRLEVVTRSSGLPALVPAREQLERTWILDELAEAPEEGDDVEVASLRGLHAKVYVQDFPSARAAMLLGSANLTDGAFGGNVEFVVRVDGPRRLLGVEATLGIDKPEGLAKLLREVPLEALGESTESESELSALQSMAMDIGSAQAVLTVRNLEDGRFDLDFELAAARARDGVTVSARLISLTEGEQQLDGGRCSWTGVLLETITPFVEIVLRQGTDVTRFLVNARLEGDPPHRRVSVLAGAIDDRDAFLRFLAALLGDLEAMPGSETFASDAQSSWTTRSGNSRLLEDLVLTASRRPAQLDPLRDLITELEKTERGRVRIPEDFRAAWSAVDQALEGAA